MIVSATMRRVGVSLVGVVSAVALTAACTSSSNGTPLNALSSAARTTPATTGPATTPAVGSGAVTAPVTLPASVPATLPVTLPAASSIPALGGSRFCTDLSSQGSLGDVGTAGNVSKALAAWDKLAAEAPNEIKGDVKAVATYLHALAGGSVDPAAAEKLSGAAANIGRYIATHCR